MAEETSTFDPSKFPLGSIAAFDVSDQPIWIPKESTVDSETKLTTDQQNAIAAMVDSVSKAESVARRLEVEGAWKLRLMDRGFHYIFPMKGGGWTIQSPSANKNEGVFAFNDRTSRHPVNVIGSKNDIIVSQLTCDIPKVEVFPKFPNNGASITAAAAGNTFKHFIEQDACFQERLSEAARYYCTDDRVAWYMRPVADAQQYGYEDETPPVVPETEGSDDPLPTGEEGGEDGEDAPAAQKTPRIRMVLSVWGKLEHKCPIVVDKNRQMAYQQGYEEWDVATARATYPWVRKNIKGGDNGVAEVVLDRMARSSIKLALRTTVTTGDSLLRDCTIQRTWLRPEMYMDDSCPDALQGWFYETFPKGLLVVYAGSQMTMVRNESVDEVLTVTHSRTGSGQNRRAITEAYAGSNMRLNNWVELSDEYFRKGIPREFMDDQAFNVPALRASSARVGVIEPFQATPGVDPATLHFSTTPASPPQSLAEAINYFAGDLAEELTGATPALAGDVDNNDGTFGAAKMRNGASKTRLSEPWWSLVMGVCSVTEQGIEWSARVQPDDAEVDRMIPGKGRLRAKIADLKGGVLVFPGANANFPESWDERESRITDMVNEAPSNPLLQGIVSLPGNASALKDAIRMDLEIPGVASTEKQEGEFEILLNSAPQPNPQLAKIQQTIAEGVQKQQADADAGTPPDPQEGQVLQQLQQAAQQLEQATPLVSSVSVRQDDSEEHAIEAAICLKKILSPEGRRLSHSEEQKDKDAFQNLMLHRQEHMAVAKQLAAANAPPPLAPKASMTVAIDKLPPEEQAAALQHMGIPADPQNFQNDLQPHEETTEVEQNTPAGKVKRTTSLSGKGL